MKNISQHTGLLTNIERLPSSINGNPRYKMIIDGFNCRTAPDSNIGYCVHSFDNKIVTCYIGSYYGYLTVESVRLVKPETYMYLGKKIHGIKKDNNTVFVCKNAINDSNKSIIEDGYLYRYLRSINNDTDNYFCFKMI